MSGDESRSGWNLAQWIQLSWTSHCKVWKGKAPSYTSLAFQGWLSHTICECWHMTDHYQHIFNILLALLLMHSIDSGSRWFSRRASAKCLNCKKELSKKFEVPRPMSSFLVKNFLISFIALSALLERLMARALWSDHCNFASKITPKTLIVLLDLIILPFNVIVSFFVWFGSFWYHDIHIFLHFNFR